MSKVTFYLMMRRESPFIVKSIKKVDSVKDGRELASLRVLLPGASMFVAEYHDGIIIKAHEVESRLSKRSKRKISK